MTLITSESLKERQKILKNLKDKRKTSLKDIRLKTSLTCEKYSGKDKVHPVTSFTSFQRNSVSDIRKRFWTTRIFIHLSFNGSRDELPLGVRRRLGNVHGVVFWLHIQSEAIVGPRADFDFTILKSRILEVERTKQWKLRKR